MGIIHSNQKNVFKKKCKPEKLVEEQLAVALAKIKELEEENYIIRIQLDQFQDTQMDYIALKRLEALTRHRSQLNPRFFERQLDSDSDNEVVEDIVDVPF